MKNRQPAFSLVEVVLALGVIAIAIVAILGLVPTGLQTSHSSQDETRSGQIAQSVFDTMASQAQTNFSAVSLPVASPAPTIDLSSSITTATSPAALLYADNDGQISQSAINATFSISILTDDFSATPSPAPFDHGYANKVTIRVVSPPLPSASATPNSNQSVRDYVRVISKY
jgi:uncharacterized protein (TIGR02598 family)